MQADGSTGCIMLHVQTGENLPSPRNSVTTYSVMHVVPTIVSLLLAYMCCIPSGVHRGRRNSRGAFLANGYWPPHKHRPMKFYKFQQHQIPNELLVVIALVHNRGVVLCAGHNNFSPHLEANYWI